MACSRELELFPEWYVKRELGIEFDSAQQMLWQNVTELLIDSALAQPKVLARGACARHVIAVHQHFGLGECAVDQ